MELTIEEALERGIGAHREGKFQEAEKFYRSILETDPKHSDAHHNLGVLAIHFDKIDLALPHFKTALESNANQSQYWISYIDALIKFGQPDAARNVLLQGRQSGLKGDRVDMLEAQLRPSHKQSSVPQERISPVLDLYRKGNFKEALRQGKALSEEFPNNATIINFLGTIHSNLAEHETALNYYNQAIELDPGYIKAHNNVGNALNELNRPEEAIVHYEKAISLNPKYAEAHNNLGNVYKEVGPVYGVLVFFIDIGKGLIIPVIVIFMGSPIWVASLCLFSLILGHVTPSPWKTPSGTGMAAAMGASLALVPLVYQFEDLFLFL